MDYGRLSIEEAEEIMELAIPVFNSLTDDKISLNSPDDNYTDEQYDDWFNVVIIPIVDNKSETWIKEMFETKQI